LAVGGEKNITLPNYPVELSSEVDFAPTVFRLIRDFDIEQIVETGALFGLGSTLIFAQTGLPVFSIECNPKFVRLARRNLKCYPNVKIIQGYSLSRKKMIEFIARDKIYGQKPRLKREGGRYAPLGYMVEISQGPGQENLLIRLIDNPKRQLVLLDSCGGVGYLEFKCFMSTRYLKNKILLLDDINHVKHYRSLKELKKMGVTFHRSCSRRWGWARF